MAVRTLTDIVSGLSAQEKSLLDNLFAKEPELKNGWLRQDDYSRRQTELKTELEKAQEAVEYKAKMEPWATTAYERIHAMEEAGVIDGDGNVLWLEQKTQLEHDLEAAKVAAVAGGDMTPAELEAKVQEIVRKAGGGLSKEEMTALYANETKKLVEDGFKAREEKFNSETIPFVGGFAAGVAVVASRYERETGEKWTSDKQKELYALMSAEGNFDPFKVEEKLMAPLKAKKDADAEVEKRVQARLKEMGAGAPGSGTERFIPQSSTKGSLQQALDRNDAATSLDQLIKQQAVESATELVAEGKF